MAKQKGYTNELNQLIKRLTPDNAAYFERLRGYMVFSGLFVDETALAEQLYQMAADLYAAQEDQVTAVEFFGKEPQEMADALLRELPPAGWKALLGIVAMVTGILWSFDLLTDFTLGTTWQLSPLSYLISPLLGIVTIYVILQILRGSFYHDKTPANKLGKGRKAALLLVIWVYLFGSILASRLLKNVGRITIPFPFDVLFIGSLGVALTIWLIWKKDKDAYPFVMMAYLFMLVGFANRLFDQLHLDSPLWRIWLPTGTLVVGVIIANIWIFRIAKREEETT